MRPHELVVYEKIAGANPAMLTHGAGVAAVPIPAYTFPHTGRPPPQPHPASGGVVLQRRYFQGIDRPHGHLPGGQPTRPVRTTIAGKIAIPVGVTISILVRNNHNDTGIDVLTATHTAAGVLRVTHCLDLTARHNRDPRKATRSKLRRNRPADPYFVWSRDQYRFSIVRA